jgi:hypothetical protein
MHYSGMRSHSEIVKSVTVEVLAGLTGKPIFTVRSWQQRDSIPSEYWAALIAHGSATADELIEAAAKKRAA